MEAYLIIDIKRWDLIPKLNQYKQEVTSRTLSGRYYKLRVLFFEFVLRIELN